MRLQACLQRSLRLVRVRFRVRVRDRVALLGLPYPTLTLRLLVEVAHVAGQRVADQGRGGGPVQS